ncbi:MAG: phosphatidylinositol-specific phospholipase C/glycerophosphodiester phosphodiesterase family protein [Allomuricauda sp.]
MKKTVALLFFLVSGVISHAQHVVKIHSHNDYEQRIPFWDAFSAGAKSIEADVFLKDGKLLVAHEEENIDSKRTLETMYLLPLKRVQQMCGDGFLDFQLMIDVKTEAYTTLDAIIGLLEGYKTYLKPYNKRGVSVVISGSRPKEKDYNDYPRFISFDCQDVSTMPKEAWKRVAMISTGFHRLSDWNGVDTLKSEDSIAVKKYIDQAKKFSKPIRFWATPDTEKAWDILLRMGVDFVNTDYPHKVQIHFRTNNFPDKKK